MPKFDVEFRDSDDGAVVPSFLEVETSIHIVPGYYDSVNDTCLRVGRILAAYNPSDSNNKNKKFIEYDVEVAHANKDGGFTNIIYPKVLMANAFGGVADYVRWMPRIDDFANFKAGLGSKVLLLCINGNSRTAYIMGGIPNPDSPNVDTKYTKDFVFEYNGVNINVNKDGDLVIRHKGATNNGGQVIDKKNGGGRFVLDQDGYIKLDYDDSKLPYLFLDKANKLVKISADTKIRSETAGTFEVQAKKGFIINSGGQAFVNGTAFRNEQEILHQNVSFELDECSRAAFNAAAQITLAGAQLAAPPLATAATWLIHLGNHLALLKIAFDRFEKNKDQYLSNNNFHSDD